MLKQVQTEATQSEGAGTAADQANAPFDLVPGDYGKGLILVCDHARNAFPPGYGSLGVPQDQLERHIAYDIGVEAVTRGIAAALDVPAVIYLYSRLFIDPNRGDDDPTLIMRISDGAAVPGNANYDDVERQFRLSEFYYPYHTAIDAMLDRAIETERDPSILSIHSFTPNWRGMDRPWHAGVLWDKDGRFPKPLIDALETEAGLVVGENEPYSGELEGDCMNKHGTCRGLRHALLEIRQDLIAHQGGIDEWIERLTRIVPPIVEDLTGTPAIAAAAGS